MGRFKRIKSARPFLTAVLILSLAAAAFALLKATQPKPEAQPVSEKRWPVSVMEAHPAQHLPQIQLLGTTESPFRTQITASVSGYIKTLHALEGATLTQDEPLLELDNRDSRILLQQRKADLDQQQALLASEQLQKKNNQTLLEQDKALLQLNRNSVQRLNALVKQGSASQSALDDARQALIRQKMTVANRQLSLDNFSNRLQQLTAQRDKAQAFYRQAKLDLERTQVRAPYNAWIAEIQVAPGDRVAPGTPLAVLYPKNQLEVRAQIPANRLESLMKTEERPPLTAFAHYQGRSIPLELRALSAQIRSGQGGRDALFRVRNQALSLSSLPIGQTVSITLNLPAIENTLALPGTAFYGQNRIYSVQNDALVSHQVERLGTAYDTDGQARILISADSLPEKSRILTTQLPNAISGLTVNIVTGNDHDREAR